MIILHKDEGVLPNVLHEMNFGKARVWINEVQGIAHAKEKAKSFVKEDRSAGYQIVNMGKMPRQSCFYAP